MIGTIAAAENGELLLEIRLDSEMRSAQSLAPGIESLLQQVGWEPADVNLVAVTSGPGSFTGLRVGVTTAKTFAYATGAQVLGINTLEAIAAGVGHAHDRVSVAIDAQRGEVSSAIYRVSEDGPPIIETPEALMTREAWLESLDPPIAVASPLLQKLREKVPEGVEIGRASCRERV